MDEKLKFVAKLLDGYSMSGLCEEFGISRKTGYKIFNRYKSFGVDGLTDRSRRPYKQSNQIPIQLEKIIISLKKEKTHWGAPKIRELLSRRYPDIKQIPAISTVHAILDRNGFVKRKRRKRYKAQGTSFSSAKKPNDLWCADYKGQFLMGNKKYCYPLTITDFTSRFLIKCESLENTKEKYAFQVFEEAFKEYGLPSAIRTDNGLPFSSPNSLYGLSKLSVWWLRLGIEIERIKPGCPQENGRHERMHLTLKKETTKPSGLNLLHQQEIFDNFIKEYNTERPHQAINMKVPSDLYSKSKIFYKGLPNIEYPLHDYEITVTNCGRICMNGKKISLSRSFAGQNVGVKEVEDKIWLVSFMQYDIGYFDEETKMVQAIENPFREKLLPMSSV